MINIHSIDDVLDHRVALLSPSNYLLGSGSNTVFTENFDGIVFVNHMTGSEFTNDKGFHRIAVASGENWHQLVCQCMELGVFGFENLALIPGTVGASPIQNIGAYGVEVKDLIESVEYLDLETGSLSTIDNAGCKFEYRDSIFKGDLFGKVFITKVHFKVPKQSSVVSHYGPLVDLQNATPADVFQKVIKTRQEKLPDPSKLGNAGSFFKNPVISNALYQATRQKYPQCPSYPMDNNFKKIPAAWLIDTLGFKGLSLNQVTCHHNQPLVLVNAGDASGEDLLSLARKIKASVKQTFNITLEHEVRLIGNTGPIDL